MTPTRIIVAGTYAEARGHQTRTAWRYASVGGDAAILVGLSHNLRAWHGLEYLLVEFVGTWRERKDLTEVMVALCVAGVDPDWLWCSLVGSGATGEEADHWVGYSITDAAVQSLKEIAASLEPLPAA